MARAASPANRIQFLDPLHRRTPCVVRGSSLGQAGSPRGAGRQGPRAARPRPRGRGQLVHGLEDRAVVSRPAELHRPGPRRRGHPGRSCGRPAKPLHPSRQRGDVARRDDEPLDPVADHRAGGGRDHARQAAGQRLVGDHGGALEERWEHEDVGRRHPGRASRRARPVPAARPGRASGQAGRARGQGAEQLELPARPADPSQASSKYLIPLRWVIPPRTGTCRSGRDASPRRAGTGAVGRIGDHADLRAAVSRGR